MKAFILSAGLGSRLAPLTNNKPKALVEVNGKPMLQLLMERLKKQNFNQIMINVHHFGNLVIDFLKQHDNFGLDIIVSDERNQLLDTGGAIIKASAFFSGSEPVLVHNVDIFADVDFNNLINIHNKSGALVSLMVRDRASSRKLLFDNNNQLSGWRNLKTGEYKWVNGRQSHLKERAYSGVYIASPEYPGKIKNRGAFPIVAEWLNIAKNNRIVGVEHEKGLWFDLGTMEKIREAENAINKQ